MTVTLYNTDENPKVLSKTLTDGVSIGDCAPYEPISDLTGSVLVPYTQTAEQCNYAMLVFTENNVNFTKYYYITDRQLEVGKKMRLYLKTDVLKTYDAQIRKCKAVFDRSAQSGLFNTTVRDSADVFSEESEKGLVKFDNIFTNDGAVIMTVLT